MEGKTQIDDEEEEYLDEEEEEEECFEEESIQDEQDEEVSLLRILKRRFNDESEEYLVEWNDGYQNWMPTEDLENEDRGLQLISQFKKEKKEKSEEKKKENIEKLKQQAKPFTSSSQRFRKTKKKAPLNTNTYSVTIVNNFRRRTTNITQLSSLSRTSSTQSETPEDLVKKQAVDVASLLSSAPKVTTETSDADKPGIQRKLTTVSISPYEKKEENEPSNVPKLITLCIRAFGQNILKIPKKHISFLPIKFKGLIVYYMSKKGLFKDNAKLKMAKLLGEQTLIDFSLINKVPNEAIEGIVKCKNLTILKLSSCQYLTDETFNKICRKCTNLTSIDISFSTASYSLSGITEGHVPKLTSLTISNVKLQLISNLLYAMAMSEKLIYLKANGVVADATQKISFYPVIRCLNLEYIDLSDTFPSYSEVISNFLSQTKFLKVKTAIISGVKHYDQLALEFLQRFHLFSPSSHQSDFPNIENVAALGFYARRIYGNIQKIKKFSLRKYGVQSQYKEPHPYQFLTRGFNNIVQLEFIDMKKIGIFEILHSPYLENLRYLNLHKCTDAFIENRDQREILTATFYSVLSAPPKRPKLTHLVLSGCNWICDAFLLIYLPLLPNLEYLNLSASPITDTGLNYIGLVPNIEILHLSGTTLSCKAIKEMVSETKKLKWLNLSNVGLSVTEIKQIASKCPSLVVLQLIDFVSSKFSPSDFLDISRASNVTRILTHEKFVQGNSSPEVEIAKISNYNLEDDFPDMGFIKQE